MARILEFFREKKIEIELQSEDDQTHCSAVKSTHTKIGALSPSLELGLYSRIRAPFQPNQIRLFLVY